MKEFQIIACSLRNIINKYNSMKIQIQKFLIIINCTIQTFWNYLNEHITQKQIKITKMLLHNHQHCSDHIGQQQIYYLNKLTQIFTTNIKTIPTGIKLQILQENYKKFIQILTINNKINKEIFKTFALSHNVESLYSQIDFFDNGFITISSITQFINHYCFEKVKEDDCRIILQAFNKSESITIQQFKGALIPQIKQNNLSVKEFQNIEISKIKFKKNQQKLNNFQEKLVQKHIRNQKYLQLVKKQNCPYVHKNQSQTKDKLLKNIQLETLKTQILFYFNKLVQLNIQRKSETEKLMQFKQFTFLNGFNIMDRTEKGFVTISTFKQFIKETQLINLNENKIEVFFQKYTNNGIMKYSDYLKIFKQIKMKQLYCNVKQRQPILKWKQTIKQHYCWFIKNYINIVFQQQRAKQYLRGILEKQSSINIIQLIFGKQNIQLKDIQKVLGNNYEQFVSQNFESQFSSNSSNWLNRIIS